MLVSFETVTFSYAGDRILSDVSFSVHEGEKVGFLGGNGEGKTTLLKLLVGELEPDAGRVTRSAKARIGYLEQSGTYDAAGTARESLREVFREDIRLIDELAAVQGEMATADSSRMRVLADRCESLQRRIAARDSYAFGRKISTVLGGMELAECADRAVRAMSGGEKTKLKLCRLLLEEPDLLVLDEPTNHLDIKTLFWLEDYLSSFKGALLVVSHDRYFLDRLTSRTLELERGKLYSYRGNYTKYRELKAERVLTERREYERQQEEIAKLQDYVDRNLVRATTAKSALSRVNRLERMELLEKPLPPPEPPRFRFGYDTEPYERVLRAENFDLVAGEKVLLRGASFTLMRGERCALVGDNGTGKSTLLKFLLSKDSRVTLGRQVRVGYYDQENADLDPEERALNLFRARNTLWSQTEARRLLAQAGLAEGDVEKKTKELSGGLRAKLELALLESRHANFLALDEPTNHLDLPARESLEEALKAFTGTLLFVSHDRRFIEALATKIACIEDGKLTVFEGTYPQFLEKRKTERAAAERAAAPSPVPRGDGYRSREERAKEARTRARVKEIEARVSLLEEEERQLDERIVEVAADYREVQKVSARQEEVRAEIEALYAEYETLI